MFCSSTFLKVVLAYIREQLADTGELTWAFEPKKSCDSWGLIRDIQICL